MSALEDIRYNERGLVPVVTQDASTREVLMLAYADKEALIKTLETGEAHYHSRSRGGLWRKGASSGNTQRVVEIRLDCDGDTLLYRVAPRGPACHTGTYSCFFTSVVSLDGEAPNLGRTLQRLTETIAERSQERPEGSYTAKLLQLGTGRIAQKVGEEAVEVVVAALYGEKLAEESADLLYHLLVLLEKRGVKPEEVAKVLDERHR